MTAVMEDPLTVAWDAEVPCQWREPCERPARWAVRSVCCTAMFVLCTPHKEEREELFRVHRNCNHLSCAKCGACPMPKPKFDLL